MEDSTSDPKPRASFPDGCCAHWTGTGRPDVMPQSVDRPGEQQDCRWQQCRGVPAAFDGWVPIVVARARLEELRDVAVRSDCPLAIGALLAHLVDAGMLRLSATFQQGVELQR